MPDGYPTRQQQMAARYSHAKAEADYLDSLNDDDRARNADDRQAVGDRMTQIQAAFEGEFPDESWDDALKGLETDTGSTDSFDVGESNLIDQGDVPEEEAKDMGDTTLTDLAENPNTADQPSMDAEASLPGMDAAATRPGMDAAASLPIGKTVDPRVVRKYNEIVAGLANRTGRDLRAFMFKDPRE
jgi:hypothetical protein